MRGDLQLDLDFPLPSTLAVGSGTAVFVCGWCFCPRARTRSLAFVVDGQVQPAAAHSMPRGDVLEALESDSSHGHRSFRSGFWGIARIAPRESEGETELLLRASLDDGSEAVAELGRVRRMPMAQPLDAEQPEPAAGPFVAICMATHEPPMHLFRRQVESIRAQTHRNWVCVVSDDSSRPEHFAAVEEALAGDPRFVVSRSPRRLGFYNNFERALSLAPPGADFFAMADQDDNWHPDKLETLIAEIGDAKLVYSDARIVTGDGRLVSDTYWDSRRNNSSNLSSLLVANSVTGAASLFRREVLDQALPFPPGQFGHFHDHWVALTALALGDIAFVERPLYDYVQHGGAVLGHAEANRMPALRERVRGVRRPLRERVGLWRFSYFVDVCRLMQLATILRMRCGDRMTTSKRRSLERFLRADRSPLALGRLALRAGRELVGRPETLGAELGLCLALVWHRIVASTAPAVGPRRRLRIDARPPTRLVQRPGRRGVDAPAVRQVADKIAPLELAIGDDAPQRINILIPTIDVDHFFGGYIAKLNLARRLGERGARVRVVTTDPVGPLPPGWRRRLESYSGLAGVFDRVELAFGRESSGLEVSRTDRFVATTWWTAHVAHAALASLRGGAPFLYLIQEYEPFTFPMGSLAALASDSYRFPHAALFSTGLLRDYFRRHGIGVYAEGTEVGDGASATFENAISEVDPPTAADLAGRSTRRLLFYARPEPHASRNMFELGVLGLSRAAEEGVFQQGWELNGIGTVDSHRRIGLGAGVSLELLPRRDQAAYADVLRAHDIGLALMHTPHPSLPPIEMAAAGMLTVTNGFENKTAEAMASISSNLVTVEPTLEGVAGGLREAVAGVEDFDRRVRGSHVTWSRGWDESFDDELMARVEGFLEA